MKVSKLSDVEQKVWAENSDRSKKMEQETKVSYRQRWDKARANKKVVFWAIIGAIVLTMIVGFSWGGWMTGRRPTPGIDLCRPVSPGSSERSKAH
jgi:hypothetical protein